MLRGSTFSPEVLVTPTADLGRILNALHNLRPQGKVALSHGIQVAQLALKHRPHKNHRQRVVVFVASPVDEDERALVKLAKKLKKNNIAVDVVNFGQEQENAGKLEAFIEAVNSGDNRWVSACPDATLVILRLVICSPYDYSHILTVPPGPHILSDVLISSAIVAGEDGAPMPGANAASFEFGVDPSMDPELALVCRCYYAVHLLFPRSLYSSLSVHYFASLR